MNKKLFVAMLLIAVLLVCTLTACAQTCVNGHGWKDGAIIKEATCTEVGKFTQKCADCSATREVSIKALGHSFGNWSANEDGLTHSRVCANDNTHIETVTHIDVDGNQLCDDCNFVLAPAECSHVWGDWTDNGDGTCSRICANDNTHIESGAHIDADENEICDNCEVNLHVHNHVESGRTPADCENDEVITYECTCGDSYTENGEGAIGHAYGVWTDNGDGTCSRICANDDTHIESGAHVDVDEDEICDNCEANLHVHNHVEISRTPADCENDEVITYECACGDLYTEIGEGATGHAYGQWFDLFDGTCFRTCANDRSHEEISAHVDTDGDEICDNCETIIHEHSYIEVAREEADCENDGAITFQCDCGNSYKDTIPATGHDWSAWAPEEGNNGTSTRVCANEPSHIETVKFFNGTTVDVEKGSLLVYYVDSTQLGEYSDIKVEFSKPIYYADDATENPGAVKENKVTVVDTYSGMAGSSYRYPFYDMVASEMGVPVTATLYGDGQLLALRTYSIATYAYNVIRNEVMPKELKTFMVDMLNYGAASQINFYYQSANLVNADLTEEEKALGTQEVPELNNIYERVEATDGSGISPTAVAVSLGSVIETNLYFTLGEHDKNDIEVVIDYFTFNGEPAQMIIDGNDIQQLLPGVDRYNVVFAKYGPSQVRDALYMSFRSKATGEKIGGTLTYSIESYISNTLSKPELKAETRELLVAMIKYAESAEAYFGTR